MEGCDVKPSQALGALIILLAAMIGGPAEARAHTGHTHKVGFHAQPVSLGDAAAVRSNVRQPTGVDRQSEATSLAAGQPAIVERTQSDAVVIDRHPGSGTCLPGTCCCLGISSCGVAGHCCAVALLHGLRADPPYASVLRVPMHNQTFHIPDVVFGLDRPPKA